MRDEMMLGVFEWPPDSGLGKVALTGERELSGPTDSIVINAVLLVTLFF